jgi:hypothetical protein
MHSEPDVTRIVRSWLRTDEHESAHRVLDNVLAVLDATPQRRSRWPVRRIADMNTYAKLAIATAAVVVVGIVGINLLPAGGRVGADGPAVSPSPSPTPAAEFPPPGPLAAGTHRAVLDTVPLSFSIRSSGWTSSEPFIVKGQDGQPDAFSLMLWESAPENVYADPCAHTPMSPAPSATAADLATAVSAIPGTDVVLGPSSVDVGGRPAQHVVLRIREDLGCDPKTAYLWYDEKTGGATGGWRWAAELGATITVWIVDVDGKRVWIDGESYKGAGPEVEQEMQQIVDSIQFE